jgi:hypothetical protein
MKKWLGCARAATLPPGRRLVSIRCEQTSPRRLTGSVCSAAGALRHPIFTGGRYHHWDVVIGGSQELLAFWAGPCRSKHGTSSVISAVE